MSVNFHLDYISSTAYPFVAKVECPWNISRLKNMICGMLNCEMNDLEIK